MLKVILKANCAKLVGASLTLSATKIKECISFFVMYNL